MCFLPETPHFLVQQKDEQGALEVIRLIHKTGSVRERLASIRHSCDTAMQASCSQLFSMEASTYLLLSWGREFKLASAEFNLMKTLYVYVLCHVVVVQCTTVCRSAYFVEPTIFLPHPGHWVLAGLHVMSFYFMATDNDCKIIPPVRKLGCVIST